MFKKKPQPKDAYEQPKAIVEEGSKKQLPISPYTGEPYDPEWGMQIIRPKANPSIISKVWK